MKKTWSCSSADLFHSIASTEEYNQILDEWAEIVYRHLCQLSENQPEVPETLLPYNGERTGTDGY